MHIAVIYNEPVPSYYTSVGEEEAVTGVLNEVAAVGQALLRLGYSVDCIPLAEPFEAAREKLRRLKTDLVFNLFEGFCGFPGTEPDIPEILSELGMPYTGCPPQALRLALNKAETKLLLRESGIDTPDFQLFDSENLSVFRLKYPCIIKPNREDASHGVTAESVVRDFPAAEKQLTRVIHHYDGEEVLVEEYIDGREFNATVLGNGKGQVLAVSEIEFSLPPDMPGILTFASKWETESEYYQGTKAVCPARISETEKQHIDRIAESSFSLTGCRGYARVDMRIDRAGRVYVIEVNPNPDISPDSGAALQAKASGLDYTDFIEKIVSLALER